jgi:hypothetical protein
MQKPGVPQMTLAHITLRAALAASIALMAGTGLAQTSPSTAIADGRPWNAIDPRGRPMTLTFHADGTARAKIGIMGKSLTWAPTDDGLCLYGAPGGDKCMTLIKTDTGYQGVENGKIALQLDR